MSYDIKDFLKKFFSSRLFVLAAVFIVFFGIILARIFTLQVVNGKSYQENFSLKIQMKQPINAARGNIYDKNGKLLAYNELAYSISINDSTTYSSTKEKNKAVNAELAEILTVLKNNGETLNNDFKIDRKKDGTYSFNVSGSSLNRFRADVFGKNSADDLEYNKDTGIDEANATAEQIMEYLMGKDNFGISSKYDGDLAYRIVVVRYAMLGNRFARYKEVKIATDVSDKTVAYVNEHMDTLSGISVNEDMIRKYNYSEYFSSIIGYTGPISESEYTALHKKNKDYTQNDTVGKAGLEQYYETYLRGKNGGTILNCDGKLRKLSLKNDSMISAAVYGDFHPSGRYAVFSSNIIIPAFHAQGSKRLEEAFESQEVLTAKVTQVLAGGLSVVVDETRVFIPASLVSDTYEKDLSKYEGQEIEFVITEFNPRKRRIIGDRKQLLTAKKEEMRKELFEHLHVNDVVEGTVKNVTDFGAFIDLGGADGLLHISEMSWGRVENPKKVFKVGDVVKVFVKEINDDKIALSMKFEETNPWNNAAEKYAVGTVVTGKVARMTDFGAFVELAPGVDALLHVSQISREHVEKPSDVLKVGQEIEAKIVDFNEEEKKISLSVKALNDDAEDAADTEE